MKRLVFLSIDLVDYDEHPCAMLTTTRSVMTDVILCAKWLSDPPRTSSMQLAVGASTQRNTRASIRSRTEMISETKFQENDLRMGNPT